MATTGVVALIMDGAAVGTMAGAAEDGITAAGEIPEVEIIRHDQMLGIEVLMGMRIKKVVQTLTEMVAEATMA